MRPLSGAPLLALSILLFMALWPSTVKAGPVWHAFSVNTNLTMPRFQIASTVAGVFSFFAGGWNGFSDACSSALDVWDKAASVMLSSSLPLLQVSQVMVTGYGSKLFVAGGSTCSVSDNEKITVATVSIYDTATGAFSTSSLSDSRRNGISGTVADLVVFAGGVLTNESTVGTVDVFNVTSGAWLPLRMLPVATAWTSSWTFQNEMWVIGGWDYLTNNDAIQVYSLATHSWTLQPFALQEPAGRIMFALVKDVIVMHYGFDVVEFTETKFAWTYNRTSGIWTNYSLPIPRWGADVAVFGNKVFFIGYEGSSVGVTTPTEQLIDVYDADTGLWSAITAPAQHDACMVQVNDTAYVMGGADVTGTALKSGWSFNLVSYEIKPLPSNLSDARTPYCASLNGKAVWVGGQINAGVSAAVDMYSSAAQTWRSFFLSERRAAMAAATVGKQVLFAGGFFSVGSQNYGSQTVDLYDMATNTWNATTPLTQPRSHLAAGSVNELALFAGGYVNAQPPWASNVVDIYNATSQQWTWQYISGYRARLSGVSLPGYVLFAGGDNGGAGDTQVDIYHYWNNSWTSGNFLSVGRHAMGAAAVGGRFAVFGGGIRNTVYKLTIINTNVTVSGVVDIWDSWTNTWSVAVGNLVPARYDSACAALGNDSVVFAGGQRATGDSLTAQVDVYNITSQTWSQLPNLVQARSSASATAVSPTGVLIVGGYAGYNTSKSEYRVAATGDWLGTFPSGGCPPNLHGDDCTCGYPQGFQVGMICLYGTWFLNSALLNFTLPITVGGPPVILQGVLNISGLILDATTISGGTLINATDCVDVSGNLTLNLPSLPTNGALLSIIQSACLSGSFDSVRVSVPGLSPCILVTGTSVQTQGGISVLISQENKCASGGSSAGITTPPSSSRKGISKGLLWGIVGAVVGVALIVFLVLITMRYAKVGPECIWHASDDEYAFRKSRSFT